ncbi:1-(5-phosphoribosyl)-5-[(5-phosphoribosylamino)methylideneamino]imidazole-4-carboxamide isomerase [Acetivibrio sp. MSJd-27]|uniref:1-(5-phosphoribosyl)-5-[(5- phosphoribosylamino)methylideneamino]imidazole-4- carboxamide isomerase n=1 Tax=Acetivibrio sp. MSJd-27 TaxID=2841523 RepID=UPI001C105B1E|nr:1-(5-phosphoribosyl)-5-[(5-phosphoribosylamino)methylideneamino]imidazole-4-carboxamide isomerase [Acetivibrio sp. MSJd-27]MBU5449806.1 1-(5-phosphoribosyl)-5-[(5-phosphoribosylamino)methylideneamino]imidazole-4-carboxamide isomerase [Acetivibrio sp. MSJd-27]
MIIYPAIDIKDGKCVRLYKGDYDKVTVYNENPLEVAQGFAEAGAEFIHLVDLDGARDGESKNKEILFEIAEKMPVPVQTGGGIRSLETVRDYLFHGVQRVILGTSAIQDKGFLELAVEEFGEKIVVGIDAKDGFVAYSGWEKLSTSRAVEFAKEAEAIGVRTIVYTDIATDGTLQGPNFKEMAQMAHSVGMNVIASGGVSCLEDIEKLKETGVKGVIVGKAIYTGNVELKEAIRIG